MASIYTRFPQLAKIPKEKFPKHIAIIPDGNRRWAREKKLPSFMGHVKGAETLIRILKDFDDLKKIPIVTFWGFSSDNWKRSKEEVRAIFSIVETQLKRILPALKKHGVRFIHLGRKDRIPNNLLKIFTKAEAETKYNKEQIICLAVDFGGEDQEIRMLEAARKLPKSVPITRDVLYKLRDATGLIPPADLLIRTAGERRTSDIGWLNGAPTELYFIEKFMPDVTTKDIVDAIIDFSKRERRFGGGKG